MRFIEFISPMTIKAEVPAAETRLSALFGAAYYNRRLGKGLAGNCDIRE
jgi:hypothetical protein